MPLGTDMMRLSVRRVVDGDGSIELSRVGPRITHDSNGAPLSAADHRLVVSMALEAMSGMLEAAIVVSDMLKIDAANRSASK